MSEDVRELERLIDGGTIEFVEFLDAGATASGAFRCVACGYGVAVSTVLPQCPMCSGTAWERELYHSYGRFAERN